MVGWNGQKYSCLAIVDKGNNRAFAHIVNGEIEALVPCSFLTRIGPPAQAINDHPTDKPDLIQMAYAIIRENLMNLEGKHRTRPHEEFEVMEFRPCFSEAFGFVGQKREVIFSLEAGDTALWDPYFGNRWDVVAGGTYVVYRLILRREKYRAPFSLLEKLRCKLNLMNYTADDENYRQHVLTPYQR